MVKVMLLLARCNVRGALQSGLGRGGIENEADGHRELELVAPTLDWPPSANAVRVPSPVNRGDTDIARSCARTMRRENLNGGTRGTILDDFECDVESIPSASDKTACRACLSMLISLGNDLTYPPSALCRRRLHHCHAKSALRVRPSKRTPKNAAQVSPVSVSI